MPQSTYFLNVFLQGEASLKSLYREQNHPKLKCSETEPYLHTIYDTHTMVSKSFTLLQKYLWHIGMDILLRLMLKRANIDAASSLLSYSCFIIDSALSTCSVLYLPALPKLQNKGIHQTHDRFRSKNEMESLKHGFWS